MDRVAQVSIVVVTVLIVAAPAKASTSGGITYTGARVHVSAAAVVSFRALARANRSEHAVDEETEEAPTPEGKDDRTRRSTRTCTSPCRPRSSRHCR